MSQGREFILSSLANLNPIDDFPQDPRIGTCPSALETQENLNLLFVINPLTGKFQGKSINVISQ